MILVSARDHNDKSKISAITRKRVIAAKSRVVIIIHTALFFFGHFDKSCPTVFRLVTMKNKKKKIEERTAKI